MVLADDTSEPHYDLALNGQNAVQVASGCRWTDVDVFDRGNEVNVITFGVNKGFTSIALAEQGMLYHKSLLRGRWDAYFQLYGTFNMRWMKNAVVRVVGITNIGLLVRVNYEIIGGRFRQSQSDTGT